MALVNRPLPNFINGISQQSAALRLPTQGEIQTNAYSSIVEGLKKRPPTSNVAKLRNTTATDAYVHTINRDTTHRYVVIVLNGSIEVYDLAGNQKTVLTPNGTAYLTSTTPRTDFDVLTVADYTFITNKTITTAMTGATTGGTNKGTIQAYANLPTSAMSIGDTYTIQGDPTNTFSTYYVQWNGSVWVETTAIGILKTIDSTKMPWKLVDNQNGTFTFDKITWNDRVVGDATSSKTPSFIGNTINGTFFHRNRLGFIADENVIFSRAGDFFNFWIHSVTAVLDSDPIDYAVTHTTVAILRHAVPFNTSLILFSDLTQFQLSAANTLTPKTVNINPTTEFETSKLCKPVGAGQSLFFVVEKSSFALVKEYEVQPLTVTNDATDVTAHVPKYIPANVFKMAASTNDDVIFALTLNERNSVYVYKYYWSDANTKVQSAWSKWSLAASDTILGMDTIGNLVYLVIQRADGVYLESANVAAGVVESDLSFLVNLDRKVSLAGVFNAGTGLTTWTLPYPETAQMQVILGSAFTGRIGNPVSITQASSTLLTAVGDYSAGTCYVGRSYTMQYRLSEITYRDYQKVIVTHYDIKLKNIDLIYTNSGYFKVVVTPLYKNTYTYFCTGKTLGSAGFVYGQVPIANGVFRFPVLSDSQRVSIDIINDSYLPCFIQAGEWEALVSTRSQRSYT